MTIQPKISRRSFLAASAAAPLAQHLLAADRYPVGLELYSVRGMLQKDLKGTVTAVAKMGYPIVEFYSPYYSWTPDYAKEVRKLLDDLGLRCLSTHNGAVSFTPEGVAKAIELNGILGSRYIVMASPPRVENMDGWKKVAEILNQAAEKMAPAKMRPGYHNHQQEFRPIEGVRPIEIIARETSKAVILQLDVGTCLEVKQDPVDWIRKNPGRFACIHLKDYSPEPDKGYRVLFGEGAAPWKQIFQVAESVGGVEFYLIEQEGYSLPELETAQRCLENYRRMRA
ncbi:MAG: sugar phosphate isomerase/epimerase [Bryobacteraceae bacterium]|nr:sugar phosphate isomerase/epimerase [Bryobacteraceae bacterium]